MSYVLLKSFILSGVMLALAPPVAAQKAERRVVVEAVPNTAHSLKNIHRVVAAKTPSGFAVPRYVSMKFGKTNGRSGPSVNHPIVWQYRRAKSAASIA